MKELKETKELAEKIEKMAKENHLPEYLIRLVIGAEKIFVKEEEISEYLDKKTSSLSSDLKAPEKFADFCLDRAKTTNDVQDFEVLYNLCPNEEYRKEIEVIWDNFILNTLQEIKTTSGENAGILNRLRLTSRIGSDVKKKATTLYIKAGLNFFTASDAIRELLLEKVKTDPGTNKEITAFLMNELAGAKGSDHLSRIYQMAQEFSLEPEFMVLIGRKWLRSINNLDIFVLIGKYQDEDFPETLRVAFRRKWDRLALKELAQTKDSSEKKELLGKTRCNSQVYKKVLKSWVLSSKSELAEAKTENEILKAIQNMPKDENLKADLELAQEKLLKVRRKKLRGIKRLDILYHSFPYYTDSKGLSHSFKLEILRKEISLADNFMDLASALVKLSELKGSESNSTFRRLENQLFKKMLPLGEKQNYETLVNNGLLKPEYQKKLIKSLAKQYAII